MAEGGVNLDIVVPEISCKRSMEVESMKFGSLVTGTSATAKIKK